MFYQVNIIKITINNFQFIFNHLIKQLKLNPSTLRHFFNSLLITAILDTIYQINFFLTILIISILSLFFMFLLYLKSHVFLISSYFLKFHHQNQTSSKKMLRTVGQCQWIKEFCIVFCRDTLYGYPNISVVVDTHKETVKKHTKTNLKKVGKKPTTWQ